MKRTQIRKAAAAVMVIVLAVSLCVGVSAAERVYLGGMPFGVTFVGGEVKISGFCQVETEGGAVSPAEDAGLLEDDVILRVAGVDIKSAPDIARALKENGSERVEVSVRREDSLITLCVTAAREKETGDLRLGLAVENGCAGLGTVTYIKEKTGEFGGLGHGITLGESGKLAAFSKGVVSEVEIVGVKRGQAGEPGELKGEFLQARLGAVSKNTESGVFGVITEMSEGWKRTLIETAKEDKVRDGGASVFCTVDGGGICEYAVEIKRLYGDDESGRDFLITVCDTSLIEKTGGIVRGMSGSPIVQDGKLIGAVTHVLISDPTRGYGIFIEDMMSEGA